MQKLIMLVVAMMMIGCGTEDIPPGSKGFMFDRTGALAGYSGGNGVQTDHILEPGTHFTGLYDRVVDINCKDANAKEQVSVLTKSDINVLVDIRLTYSADCSSAKRLSRIFDQVTLDPDHLTIEPGQLYELYLLPIIRESLRNRLSSVSVEEVKNVREEVRDQIMKDLKTSIDGDNRPVLIKLVAVSDIQLPPQIVEKNQLIELARQEAEQEREKQEAAKYRLERELFEAQEDRKVQTELAERMKDVELIDAEKNRQVAVLRAKGIEAMRVQLTPAYLEFLRIQKDTEVGKATAKAMSKGTVWYVGPDFAIAPGSPVNVAVSK